MKQIGAIKVLDQAEHDKTTILLCYNCIPKNVYCYRIGGTFHPSICEKCGKEEYLGEYVVSTIRPLMSNLEPLKLTDLTNKKSVL